MSQLVLSEALVPAEHWVGAERSRLMNHQAGKEYLPYALSIAVNDLRGDYPHTRSPISYAEGAFGPLNGPLLEVAGEVVSAGVSDP